MTPLHLAAWFDRRAITELLLATGAWIGAKDENGRTALHWAAAEGHTQVAASLVGQGADLEARDEAGKTPLHWAVWLNHPDVVELLLSRGGDPLVRDPFGRTTLEIARAQVTTEAGSTPLVHAERRQQIVTACAAIADLLVRRNSPA